MAWNIYVTRKIPEAGLEILRKSGARVEVNLEDRPLTHEELLAAVRGRDGVLCLLHDAINAPVLAAADRARGFANYAVGFNNIDVGEATRQKIAITNTPGVLTEATADLAWALLLAVARRIGECERVLRSGQWSGWGPLQFLGADVSGQTLGICGAGRIGAAVAQRARGFGMRVLYYNRSPQPEWETKFEACRVDKAILLSESDFISVHLPLTSETRHFFGESEFRAMKKSAIFVNTARGLIHDEHALVRALQQGWIAGAGLDVYENEPALAMGLAQCQNTVLVPHIGSATLATRNKMATMSATNLVAILRGEQPQNLVNPEAWPGRSLAP